MEKTRKRRGTGRVMLQEVANFAGIGTTTASHALRTPKQVSDRLREGIEQAVEELGYIPNRIAGALASGHSHTVAILVPSLTGKISSRFVQSLRQILNKNEFRLLLGCHEYSQLKEAETLVTLLQGNPAALVIFGSQSADKTHRILEKISIPTVNVVGSSFSPAQTTIETALFKASHKLTERLLEQGYRNIEFIGTHMEDRLRRQQLSGWHKAMLSHYQNTDLAITMLDVTSLRLGRYALNKISLRQSELNAMTCSHEEITLGIMFECQRRLLKVPRNIAVTCLDGSDSCDRTHPTLTSVRIDYKKVGIETGKLLVELLDNNHDKSEESRIVQFNYQIELRQSIWA